MHLYYDERDDTFHEARGSQILYWLDDLGAKPLTEARPDDSGFLFAGARPLADYRNLVNGLPLLRDQAVRAIVVAVAVLFDMAEQMRPCFVVSVTVASVIRVIMGNV